MFAGIVLWLAHGLSPAEPPSAVFKLEGPICRRYLISGCVTRIVETPAEYQGRSFEESAYGVICPVCREKGIKSKVYVSPTVDRTAMWSERAMPWFDEDGRAHPGCDPNWTTITYSCSNGHQFFEKMRDPCNEK